MRLLLDTNIFLEVILGQEAASDAQAVLVSGNAHDLYASDYTIHSIGVLLFRTGRPELFEAVVEDMIRGAIAPITIPLADLHLVADAAKKFGLDFDDSYQYTAASLNDLQVVSFDHDFDRTDRGRTTPAQL